MKVLHSADWHVKDSMIEEAERCLNCLVDTAFNESVNLIVIAGDLFDSQDVKLDSQAAKLVIEKIRDLSNVCPVAIVFGTPSHDGHAPEILEHIHGAWPVIVADKPMQVCFSESGFANEEDNEGYGLSADAVISLIPQPTKQFFQSAGSITQTDQEIGQAMSALFAGFGIQAAEYNAPHILVYHGAISGAFGAHPLDADYSSMLFELFVMSFTIPPPLDVQRTASIDFTFLPFIVSPHWGIENPSMICCLVVMSTAQ